MFKNFFMCMLFTIVFKIKGVCIFVISLLKKLAHMQYVLKIVCDHLQLYLTTYLFR